MQNIHVFPKGLSGREAETSRKKHGSNLLNKRKRTSTFKKFLTAFKDPIIRILLAALGINFVFLFRSFDILETLGIVVSILLATTVSALSERGSELAFDKLQEEIAAIFCRVLRDGQVVSLPIGDIVAGDIVLLEAGERVPADGYLLAGTLSVDQSALNGESKESKKTPRFNQEPPIWSPADPTLLFRGSIVAEGSGQMAVLRVGIRTLYGQLSEEIQEEDAESPLKARLTKLAKQMSKIGYGMAALVAFAYLFNSICIEGGMTYAGMLVKLSSPSFVFGELIHAITLATTVIVVAVPEGLPMMISVVLSANIKRMQKDLVLVRKPVGIETAGSLNLLFTDKTGTLTQGKLSLEKILLSDGSEHTLAAMKNSPLAPLVLSSLSLNNAAVLSGRKAIGGNATDRTLLEAAGKHGGKRTDYVPFDSIKKYSACSDSKLGYIKGAPEVILSRATRQFDAQGNIVRVNRKWLTSLLQKDTSQGGRVLALAISERPRSYDANLIFLCFVLLRDTLRPDAKEAVGSLTGAGVQVVMITGDNRDTAVSIAKECRILQKETDVVLTSAELADMPDGAVLKLLPRLRVVARALPSDKSRLLRLARQGGLVAGMTGDGINDAPALKIADVGFSMGSGTEIAKEAGDIVIVDDSLTSVAKAVKYGRTIFKSIRKFIVFQLTMNLSAVGILIICPFIGVETPVTVLQMLWINMIMDTLGSLAFAGEFPLQDYMKEPPKKRSENILNGYMVTQILAMGTYIIGLSLAFFLCPWAKERFLYNSNPIYCLTAFFSLFIFLGIFNCYNVRTSRKNLFAGLGENTAFMIIMTGITVVQITLLYCGGSLFRTTPLRTHDFFLTLLLAVTVFPVSLLVKIIFTKIKRNNL
ncbi:MAG TPA: calcium-translocating P-type ATPase, PMCA-type, partial [Clostridiales bacterium]|nr:calcium-translocating P-type ATPase, PMCA-type [Clostridiales bacterium]